MKIKTANITFDKAWLFRLNTILFILAFSIPFLISGPQILTGTMVNALLFIFATKQIKQNDLYLISFLPGLGALSNGLLFGKFTLYLLFFLPFIWLGNLVLIWSFNKVRLHTVFPLTVIIPAVIKAALLYLSAVILVGNHLVPKVFLSSMGMVQTLTALLGGIIVSVLFRIAGRKI